MSRQSSALHSHAQVDSSQHAKSVDAAQAQSVKRLQIDSLLSALRVTPPLSPVASPDANALTGAHAEPPSAPHPSGVYVHGIDVWPRLKADLDRLDLDSRQNLIAGLLKSGALKGLGRAVGCRLENLARFIDACGANELLSDFNELLRKLQVPVMVHLIRRSVAARSMDDPLWQCLLLESGCADSRLSFLNLARNAFISDERFFDKHHEASSLKRENPPAQTRATIQSLFEDAFC